MYRRAQAIGEEARGKGINTQFGPGVNLMRTPQAGRAFECKWYVREDLRADLMQTTVPTPTLPVSPLNNMSWGKHCGA